MAPRALNVLVVDDNAHAADTLAALPEAFGHLGQCAYTGPQAQDMIWTQLFDVAVHGAPPLLIALSGYCRARTCRRCWRRDSTGTWSSRWTRRCCWKH